VIHSLNLHSRNVRAQKSVIEEPQISPVTYIVLLGRLKIEALDPKIPESRDLGDFGRREWLHAMFELTR
jgi:hypothetical protein